MKHTTKKWLSVLLTVVLTFGYAGLLSGVVGSDLFGTKLTAHADTWSGTISDPGGSEYVTSGNTVHLKSARALVWFINRIANGNSFENMTVYLDVDVDLGSHDFGNTVFPYNSGRLFKGTFDGQNHTISNFKMTHSDHRVAMFRQTSNATFRNLNFNSVFIDDSSDSNKKNGFAVLVGYHDSGNLTFENVHVNSGNIYGYNYVGALVGEVGANSSGNKVTMTNCSNGATISGNNVRIGGLVGSSLPVVIATNCSNTGNVTGGSTDVGGIVGWIQDDASSFSGCQNSGNIKGSDSIGGILGYFGDPSHDQKLTLTNNTNTGTITSDNRAAGICALIDTDNNAHEISGNTNRGTINAGSDGGGIVARNKGFGVWTNNRNYGSVRGGNDNAGGICGEVEDDKQVFSNCYNSGAITGQNTTGGIAGWLDTAHENTFTRCANSGNITSNGGYAAGIQGGGKKESTFTECYNVGTVSGQGDSGGLAGHVEYHTFWNRCFNAGNVTAPSSKSTGGLIGYTSYYGNDTNYRMVDDCFNWGTITAGTAGGLVGYVNDGKPYKVEYSYNTGTVNGSSNAWAFVGHGGNCGNQCFKTWNTGSGTYKTSQEMIDYNFSIDSYFCKNTWGVKVNGTTYYYPILTWYRNLFLFNSTFRDGPTNTNNTISKLYNNSFITPTVSGVSGNWVNDDNWNASFAQGATINSGVTVPTNQYVITQETSNVESIHNDTTYHLHRSLALNTQENVNIRISHDCLYYTFTPSESGNYVFFSYGTSVDSQIYVYASDRSQLAYNDDYSHSSTNTDGKGSEIRVLLGNGATSTTTQSYTVGSTESYTVVNLTANTTYYVMTRCYSIYTGTFPMKVCKAVNITFNGAGGTKSDNASVTYIMPAGHTMHMDKTGLTRADHTLIAWSTTSSKEQNKNCMASATVTVPAADTTYYALWNPTAPTVAQVNTDYTVTVGSDYQVVYYSFTPSETRKYYIHSTNSSLSPDPFAVLMEAGAWASGATYLMSNDDGDGNRQFAIKNQKLTAGTQYLIGAKLYDSGTGSYPFRIEPIYTVTYYANGGSGAPTSQDKYYNKPLTLSSDRPTREGYTFLGWSTVQNATSAAFYPGGSYSSNADLTLYAVWQIHSSDLKIDPNGGTRNGTTDPITYTRNYGEVFSVGTPTPPTAQYLFTGWTLDEGANGSFDSATNKYTFGPAANTTDFLRASYVQVVRDDTFVLDFGLTAKLDVLANDLTGVTLVSVAPGAGCTASVKSGKIEFAPDAAMTDVLTLTYTASYQSKTFTANVTVIPANNVYYEDGFVDFSDTSGALWQTAGEEADTVQNAARPGDADAVYGSSAAYETSATYSLGSARYVEVNQDHKLASNAVFTFTGTGFDLYAVTDGDTGVAMVELSRLNGDTWQPVSRRLVNTYYGYNYGRLYLKDGKVTLDSSGSPIYYAPAGQTDDTFFIRGTVRGWLTPTHYESGKVVTPGEGNETTAACAYGWVAGAPSSGSPDGVYQAPVISDIGLPFGTYRVTVQPRYVARQDMTGGDGYRFYIDAVRVYDPLNPETLDDAVANAYRTDREYGAKFTELRDQLIGDPKTADLTEGSASGLAFLENRADGSAESLMQEYKDLGPKNEIYLGSGQAVTFTLTTGDSLQPAKLSLGMKLLSGGENVSGTVRVSCNGKQTDCTLQSATDLYREITGVIDWTATDDNTFTTGPITITNTGNTVVSLTKLKWSYGAADAAQAAFAPKMLRFSVGKADLTFARTVFDEINDEQTTASSEGVTVTWDNAEVEIGGTATLTITAPATFEKAFKDGNEIAGYTELPDGSRQWTVTVTVEEAGEYACDVTLEDENGYRTKAISAGSFTVVPPAEPDPVDNGSGTGDQTGDQTGSENGSGAENATGRRSFSDLLQAIINFFRKIVAFFRGMID